MGFSTGSLGISRGTVKYFQKRQNPLTHCSEVEIEAAFQKIAESFGYDWLRQENGEHILQKLWNRRDALSTNELFTFGSALIAPDNLDPAWLQRQIKLVRSKDENNQKGAAFEILAVRYMSSKQTVIPASANQRGYDVDVETGNSSAYRISLKCYSQSTHEKQFRKKSELARQKFIKDATASTKNAQIFIEALKFPSEGDWKSLYTYLTKLAASFNGSRQVGTIKDVWTIGVLPLMPDGSENFAKGHFSHTFICVSPFHKNEQNNFISKLESAVSNLEKHVDSHESHIPLIFMRLPPTASSSALKTWAENYFEEHASTIVNGIFFIQPYIASDEKASKSHIAHYVTAAVSRRFSETQKQALQFELPVGVVTSQPPLWKLRSDVDKKQLDTQYVYQHGEHYISARQVAGGLEGNIVRKAPGIYSFLVMELDGKSLTLGGRWGEDVCLIGG